MTTSAGRRDDDEDVHDAQSIETPLLAEPPWSRVRRVQLIRREIREVLSPGAVEVLFEHAEVIVEGGDELGSRRAGGPRFYATVMVTIDLSRCAPHFRDRTDDATARRVGELMQTDPQVQRKLHTLAARELARLAGADPSALSLAFEFTVRTDGSSVLIDVDTVATAAQRRG